jgi:hypothetical protein
MHAASYSVRRLAAGLLCALLMLSVTACAKSGQDAHSEIARRLIAQQGTPDFADASTAEYAAIQHTPSGLMCVLPADGAFHFELFPAEAANAGAQCTTTRGDVVTAWLAVRFHQPTSLDAVFADAVAQLAQGPDTQAWDGRPSAADRASPAGLAHYRISRVIGSLDGQRRYLRLAVSERDGWYLQQIVSAPAESAENAEAAAGTEWRGALAAFSATSQAHASR